MRLLQVSANSYDPISAWESHTARIWREAARHFDELFIVARNSSSRFDVVQSGNVTLLLVPRLGPASLEFMLTGWLALPWLLRLHPSQVLAQSPLHTGPLARFAAAVARCPLIVEIHDEHYMRGLPYPGLLRAVFSRVVARSLRSADLIRVLTPTMGEELVRAYPRVDARTIFVSPTRVDVKLFAPAKKDYALGPRVRIVNVGSLSSRKRQSALLEFAARAGRPVHVDLVGDGPSRAELEALVKRLDVSATFHGQLVPTEVAEVLRQADLMMHVSEREALPRALLEGMAVGLPVVVVPSGYVRDLVTDRETGVIVTDHSDGSLRRALDELCGDEAYRKRLGTAAADLVAQRYEWTSVLTEQFESYKALRHQTPGASRQVKWDDRTAAFGTGAAATPHVLEVIKSLDRGGAEALLAQRVLSTEPGVRYTVAAMRSGPGSLVPELRAAGVDVTLLAKSGLLGNIRGVMRLRKLIRSSRADVVHVHSPVLAIWCRFLCRRARRRGTLRLVVTEHSTTYRLLTRLANRATSGFEDATIAVSEAVAQALPPRSRGHLEVIHHGVDRKLIAEYGEGRPTTWREQLSITPENRLIVTIANCRPAKRLDRLIDVAELVAQSIDGCVFVVAGDGVERPSLERRATEASARVEFLGAVPQAWTLLVEADLFLLTSDWEGLPVAVMEALAASVPVVATDVGGLREIVTPEVGILCPPQEVEQMARTVVAMLKDAERRAALARGAATRSRSFDSAASHRQIEQVLIGPSRQR